MLFIRGLISGLTLHCFLLFFEFFHFAFVVFHETALFGGFFLVVFDLLEDCFFVDEELFDEESLEDSDES